jgi:GrpB-like predicted nucleotidyltransferase (UPF0157 family)/8-oxo-dGTP pyrophosphatase MutT (NUDIX family)
MFKFAPEKYHGGWPEIFKAEASRILSHCGSTVRRIEHIGSTSVAGLMAKPIIDILIETTPYGMAELAVSMTRLGFLAKGEYGIPGRAYFTRDATNKKMALHVHAFAAGHDAITKHLAFRDYLRAHPAAATKYQNLKVHLLSEPNLTRDQYQTGKSSFISELDVLAQLWFAGRPAQTKPVRKAVIYALKNTAAPQVLVFDHVQYPEVSPQVPAGTIDPNETPAKGAHREFLEETGFQLKDPLTFLGSYVFHKAQSDQFHERFCFAIRGDTLPESWTHEVTGSGEDQRMAFRYYWLPIAEATDRLQAHLGNGLVFFNETLLAVMP